MDVALRKESVDRNIIDTNFAILCAKSLSARRAWIEIRSGSCTINGLMSLSARRAWIEISCSRYNVYRFCVALRKESVDRNIFRDAGGTESI